MEVFGIQAIVLFVVLGAAAGFLAGLLGIGGGIILVPLFLWSFPHAGFQPDLTVHAAFATSLAIIFPTSISSTLGHRKRGNVQWHQVFYLAAGGAFGAVAGASAAASFSGIWLKGLFGLMQILVALKLLIFHPHMPPERLDQPGKAGLVAVGLIGGSFSAFFGVGGGVVAVPLMVLALRLPIHLAVGNSSALIVISSLFGALSYTWHGWHIPGLPPFSSGYVNVLVAGLVAPFTILTARLGVRVAGRTSHAKMIKIFAGLLILVGLRMMISVYLSQ